MNSEISNERKKFLKNKKIYKYKVIFTQIFIVLFFIVLWEMLARLEIINPFITSMPSRILETLCDF